MTPISRALIASACAFFLSGCFDTSTSASTPNTLVEDPSRPSDAVTHDPIYQAARADALPGTTIIDFERTNGYVVPEAPHRYMVQYDYKLKLEKPLGEAALDLIPVLRQHYAMMEWEGQIIYDRDINGTPKKRDLFQLIAECDSCKTYLGYDIKDPTSDQKSAMESRFYAFVRAVLVYENYSFTLSSQPGDIVSRLYRMPFIQSEQGWIVAP